MLAAVAASLSAAAAAVGFVAVGHVAGKLADGPLGLVLHGEQLVGDWLLYTPCQRKARTYCRVKMVVIVIVRLRSE